MPIFRINKSKNYTVMANTHFYERDMSLKAKGLLSLMLSLPDDWDYSVAGLVALSSDGRDSVTSALSELEEHGYLTRERITDEKGRFAGYDYNIFETPQTIEAFSENPITENPITDKRQQVISTVILDNGTYHYKEKKTNIQSESVDSGYDHQFLSTDDSFLPAHANDPLPASFKMPPVPYQQIVDLYHQKCAGLPVVRMITDARKKAIKARFETTGVTFDTFSELFDKVASSDFLMKGKTEEWKAGCNFDWLMNASNFAKVLEGRYDCRNSVTNSDGTTIRKLPTFAKESELMSYVRNATSKAQLQALSDDDINCLMSTSSFRQVYKDAQNRCR